ncbi:hypothetical protein [Micromonospora sp. S4605]|uniref:hypothetical protein n=1 Tax=Micromonospora sp. S4605 TaxID=1420897 RepID=UPI00130507EA|nr:hypothetical protein [Micromonospora sp. S4605]
MIVAVPSPSSRLYGPVADIVGSRFAGLDEAHRRSLWHRMGADSLIRCRGFDIPELVASGAVDVGITGYDVCVEWCLANDQPLTIRALPPARTSFVTYCAVAGRKPRTIYTEYPAITRAWLDACANLRSMRIVRLNGATEGVIRADDSGAGVLLVTSGQTLAANGLDVEVPLLATDVCVVTRTPSCSGGTLIDLPALPVLPLPSFATQRASGEPIQRQTRRRAASVTRGASGGSSRGA